MDDDSKMQIGSGLYIGAAEQLVYSAELLAEPGDGDPVYDPEIHHLSNTLSLTPAESQDVVLYLLRYDYETKNWVCELTGSDWARGDGVTVTAAEQDNKCRVIAHTAGAHSIVRLEGEEMKNEEGNTEYTPIPGSTRGIPLTVRVSKDFLLKIDREVNTIHLENLTEEQVSIRLLLATYDGDGRMCGVNMKEGLLGENDIWTVSVPSEPDAAYVRVFLLNPDTHAPLRVMREFSLQTVSR